MKNTLIIFGITVLMYASFFAGKSESKTVYQDVEVRVLPENVSPIELIEKRCIDLGGTITAGINDILCYKNYDSYHWSVYRDAWVMKGLQELK